MSKKKALLVEMRGLRGAKPGGLSTYKITKQSLSLLLRKIQCSAEHPVAALTAHWAVIHYRDCASLTLYTRES